MRLWAVGFSGFRRSRLGFVTACLSTFRAFLLEFLFRLLYPIFPKCMRSRQPSSRTVKPKLQQNGKQGLLTELLGS